MNNKIILNLAISLDGFIADSKGGFSWIKGDGDKIHDTKEQFDFQKFIDSVGGVKEPEAGMWLTGLEYQSR